MFAFEKLEVYKRSIQLYKAIDELKFGRGMSDRIIRHQLLRASLSVSLNIAEGTGKEGLKDRRNFLLISRGSLYETVAIINILNLSGSIDEKEYNHIYSLAEEISKMLYAMIRGLNPVPP